MREKLMTLSLAVLRDIAKDKNIKSVTAMRKNELIEAILKVSEEDGSLATAENEVKTQKSENAGEKVREREKAENKMQEREKTEAKAQEREKTEAKTQECENSEGEPQAQDNAENKEKPEKRNRNSCDNFKNIKKVFY